MNNDDNTPLPTLDDRGAIALRRDQCRDMDDTPTGETCPCCAGENGAPGDGVIRTETAAGYRAVSCELCEGASFVSAAKASAWRLSQRG